MRRGKVLLNFVFCLTVGIMITNSVSPAAAAERHVHPGGSIQDIISDSNTIDSDVIIVHQGIYYETINFLGKAITTDFFNSAQD